MEENDRQKLDEKTALLIEQTDESLRKMEKTLGPDHPVVGKILDTYAKLLRQNNHRILGAINMEARAKAIRAKHNQEEAEAQAKVFEDTSTHKPIQRQQPGVSASRVRMFFWLVVIILVGTVTVSGMRTVKTVGKHDSAKKKSLPSTEKTTTSAADPTAPSDGPPPAAQTDLPTAQQPAPTQTPVKSGEQIDKEFADIKEEIAQLAKHGQEYAEAGNSADAEEAFKTAISTAGNASVPGRPFVSDELALAFDQYATILEARGESDKSSEMRNSAKGVRRILAQRAAAANQN